MDVQAASVLATLKKSSATADTKLQQLNELKSSIKHLRVPAPAQAAVFECVRAAIGSQTLPQLVPVGFSTLSHLVKRLGLQKDDAAIAGYAPKLLAVLLDRLGDSREPHRAAASQAFRDIWIYAPADVERVLRDNALQGANVRAREAAMIWVVQMHQNEGLQFKSFLPLVVATLEDADSQLRETAKASIVSLFLSAPARAKVDLRKQLIAHSVRKTTVSYILTNINDCPDPPQSAPAATDPSFSYPLSASSVSGLSQVSAPEPMDGPAGPIEPSYLHSHSEWDQLVRSMLPAFVGKETNDNWELRDQQVTRIRRILRGNAPTDFPDSFMAGVKALLEGVIKASESLRTTVSTNGCQLMQELFRSLGPSMDLHTEIVMQTYVKLAASTKRINSINGSDTIEAVFQIVPFSVRSLQHIWFAATDKNVIVRSCAPGWLRILVAKHRSMKTMVQNSVAVELVQKTVIKGLTDANPKVRESARETYRTVIAVWPEMADPVLAALPSRDRQTLESGLANLSGISGRSSGTGSASSRSAKPSLREAIAAQKRSLAAKQAAALTRPASAQSTLSPPGPSRTRPPSAFSTQSSLSVSVAPSLMSGAVRRPRRPEISRPATAEPFSAHLLNKQSPAASPLGSPVISRAVPRSPRRIASVASIAASVRSASRLVDGVADITDEMDVDVFAPSVVDQSASALSDDQTATIVVVDDDEQYASQEPDTAVHDSRATDLHGVDGTVEIEADVEMVGPVEDEPVVEAEKHLSSPLQSPSPVLEPAAEPVVKDEPAPPTPAPVTPPAATAGFAHQTPPSAATAGLAHHTPPPASTAEPIAVDLAVDEREYLEAAVTQPGSPLPLGPIDVSALAINDNRDRPISVRQSAFSSHTPTHGMDANRIRGLLFTAIDRLRARTLDPHGLRRIQDIVRNPIVADVFAANTSLVRDLMSSLLDLLEARESESFASSKPTSRAKVASLKAQTLSTIRVLVTVRQKDVLMSPPASTPVSASSFKSGSSPALWIAILRSLIRARREYAETEHLAAEMHRMATDVCNIAPSSQLADAIVVLVGVLEDVAPPPTVGRPDRSDSPDSPGDGRVAMAGLRVLRALITKVSSPGLEADPVPNPARLGQLVVMLLNSADPDVRCEVLEFCLAFHRRLLASTAASPVEQIDRAGSAVGPFSSTAGLDFSSSPFWKVVAGVREQHLNLIIYYLARNSVGG